MKRRSIIHLLFLVFIHRRSEELENMIINTMLGKEEAQESIRVADTNGDGIEYRRGVFAVDMMSM